MVNVRRLIWDTENVPHIADHGVTREEVEEVCQGDHIVREGYGRRIVLIGPTGAGRLLAVVLASKGRGTYYAVTSYPAKRKLQRMYEQEREGRR